MNLTTYLREYFVVCFHNICLKCKIYRTLHVSSGARPNYATTVAWSIFGDSWLYPKRQCLLIIQMRAMRWWAHLWWKGHWCVVNSALSRGGWTLSSLTNDAMLSLTKFPWETKRNRIFHRSFGWTVNKFRHYCPFDTRSSAPSPPELCITKNEKNIISIFRYSAEKRQWNEMV